jgi:hypothetical protein
MIKSNMFKLVIKIIFISSSPFVFLIINFNYFSIFKKNDTHLIKKKDVYPLLKFKCFEHAKKN